MGGIWKPAGRKAYRIWYKDHAGRRHTAPGYADKAASLAKLQRLETNAARRAEGLPVPDDSAGLRPLAELVDKHMADLERQGAGPDHLKGRRGFLVRLARWEGWQLLRDVQHGPMTEALARLKGRGRSDQTLEHYRHNWRAFLSWCVDARLLEANPISRVKGIRRKQAARPKRPFTLGEWRQLLAVDGRRRDAYFLAALTGLRRKELSLLECRDVDLAEPCLRLRAEATKGRRADVVPLLPDAVPTLTRLCDGRGPLERVVAVPGGGTVSRDVARAGLESPDAAGFHLSFHSLRYTFCSLLARTLPIQVVRLLMRHRDISQTCKVYLRLGLADVAEGLQKLPSVL